MLSDVPGLHSRQILGTLLDIAPEALKAASAMKSACAHSLCNSLYTQYVNHCIEEIRRLSLAFLAAQTNPSNS